MCMYIRRNKEGKIRKLLELKEIVAVIGPRQAGKTTIINKILDEIKDKKITRITFDNLEILNEFESDLELFIEKYVLNSQILFIDEVQYSKNSGQKLKYIYDTYKIKIVLSGSSATEISLNTSKYLVGRIFIIELLTLSFQEFLSFKDASLSKLLYSNSPLNPQRIELCEKYLKEYLLFGGYPQVVLLEDEEIKFEALKNIYNTYLLKEIKEILQFSEYFKLDKVVKLLSSQVSNLVNVSQLGNDTSLKTEEINSILFILENTYIIKLLQPFYRNKHTELVKANKVYFFDLGLRNILLNIRSLSQITNLGEMYENVVLCELIREDIDLKYWRNKSKSEVDFIVEVAHKVIPIEVKGRQNNTSLTRSYMSFIEKYDILEGFIFNLNLEDSRRVDENTINFVTFYRGVREVLRVLRG